MSKLINETTTTIHIPTIVADDLLDLAGFYYNESMQWWACRATGDTFWMKDEALLIALEHVANHATI